MVEIKDRLYVMMAKLNIAQTDMSKKTGISKSSLSMYLAGTRIPKADKIYMICNAYGVNEPWLMGYEDVPMMRPDPAAQATEDVELLQKWYKLSPANRSLVTNLIDSLLSNS